MRPLRERDGVFLAEVAVLGRGPVPVSVKSLRPTSSRLGESFDGRVAMLDFGESLTLVLEMEREKRESKLALLWWMLSVSWTTYVFGVLGEGVRGMRPPARRVEKMPSRRLMGVSTDIVAISA